MFVRFYSVRNTGSVEKDDATDVRHAVRYANKLHDVAYLTGCRTMCFLNVFFKKSSQIFDSPPEGTILYLPIVSSLRDFGENAEHFLSAD